MLSATVWPSDVSTAQDHVAKSLGPSAAYCYENFCAGSASLIALRSLEPNRLSSDSAPYVGELTRHGQSDRQGIPLARDAAKRHNFHYQRDRRPRWSMRPISGGSCA